MPVWLLKMGEKCLLEDVKKGVIHSPYRARVVKSSLQREKFPKTSRILKKGTFKALFEKGSRFRGEFCTIDYLSSAKGDKRLGITASAKTGPAILRNRFKRLSREVFRTHKGILPKGYLLGIRPKGKIETVTFTSLSADFRNLAEFLMLKKSP